MEILFYDVLGLLVTILCFFIYGGKQTFSLKASFKRKKELLDRIDQVAKKTTTKQV